VRGAIHRGRHSLSHSPHPKALRSEMHYLNRRPASERTQPKISPSRIPTRKVSSWVAPRGCLPDRNGESLFSNEKLHAQHAPSAHILGRVCCWNCLFARLANERPVATHSRSANTNHATIIRFIYKRNANTIF